MGKGEVQWAQNVGRGLCLQRPVVFGSQPPGSAPIPPHTPALPEGPHSRLSPVARHPRHSASGPFRVDSPLELNLSQPAWHTWALPGWSDPMGHPRLPAQHCQHPPHPQGQPGRWNCARPTCVSPFSPSFWNNSSCPAKPPSPPPSPSRQGGAPSVRLNCSVCPLIRW